MANKIECAFTGVLIRDAEARTAAASGRRWLNLPLAVGDDDARQIVFAASFSETVADMAPHLTKGTALYIEGVLKLRTWQGPEGMQAGLSVSASLVQPLALIGNRKPKKTRTTSAAKRTDPNAPISFNDALPF